MRGRLSLAFVALSFLTIFPTFESRWLYSQGAEASLLGTVQDNSGAVLPGATVTATNTATGRSRTALTDDRGNYLIVSLTPSSYDVSAELSGFKRSVLKNVTLQVGQEARLNITLEVGEIREEVTVTGSAPSIETESAAIGDVVEQKAIVELPLNGRNPMQLGVLTSGVNESNKSRQASNRGFAPAVGGQSVAENRYLLDGANNTNAFDHGLGFIPTVESVQEFRIQVGMYSAEYGGGGGAIVNILTRSGTNEFHGNVFEFMRNDALDARNFFATENPPFKRNQFGGALGGPIVRDKTFFYAGYEGTRIRKGLTFTGVVPAAEQRRGDLSGFRKTLRDPIRNESFPGGIIPENRIDPISKFFLAYWPLPNNPGAERNWVVSPSSRVDGDRFQIRIDHNLSRQHTLYGRYSGERLSSYTPGPFSEATAVGGQTDEPEYKNATVKLTSSLAPALVNEFQFGYNRSEFQDLRGQNLGNPIARDAGLNSLIQPISDTFAEGFPENLGLSRTIINGLSETNPQLGRPEDFSFQDKMTWTRGTHYFKFGGDFTRIAAFLRQGTHSNGNYTFDGTLTGDGFADFLLGWPGSFNNNIGPNREQNYQRVQAAFFFVDDWKATRNLTINYGLRYEIETAPRERDGHVPLFDPNLIGPTGARGGLAYPKQNTFAADFFTKVRPDLPFRFLDRDSSFLADLNNFAPRFGFAYRPFGGTRTVVRGGYGWYYSSPNQIQSVNNGFSAPPASLWPVAVTDPNFPTLGWNSVSGISDPNELFKNLTFGVITGSEEQFLNGYNQQWSLTIGQELSQDLGLEVQYMGSKSTHLEIAFDENYASPDSTALSRRVPFPAWARLLGWHSGANSNYNALMVSAEKRYAAGLAFRVSWTWGHGLASYGARIRSDRFGAVQDPTNMAAEVGPIGNDVRHRFIGYWVYELPFGPGKRFAASTSGPLGHVIGGWHFTGIYNARSPFPILFSPQIARSRCNASFNNECRPNVVDINKIDLGGNGVDRPKFNRDAFQVRPFTFGNAGYNLLRGNITNNWDLMISKNFRHSERYRIEFRFEMFNAFNHPQFDDPNASLENPLFGRTFTALDARSLQFGLKLHW